MKRMLLLITLGALTPSGALGQYWGERVLEKSFEQTDFFFTPSYLNPYGIGRFERATPGLLRDPLLDYIVNPAWVDLDSLQRTFVYMDFRTARTIREEPSWYMPPYLAGSLGATDAIYYPHIYMSTRRELEPVFSGALLGRLAGEDVPGLLAGLTYQLVLQDDNYYNIPQDIYRTTPGHDYNGARAAAAEALPIVDKYSGKDNINQTGHFLNAFLRYALPLGLDLGAKISRVTFTREGAFGSSNFWEHAYYGSSTSLWSNFENRAQEYGHWDLAGGVRYRLMPQLVLGVSAGYLWGDATQSLGRDDSSYWASSYPEGGGFYDRAGNTAQDWAHDGRTSYFGIDLLSTPSGSTTLTVLYRREHARVDLGLGSMIVDTSYSRYSWTDTEGLVTSYSESFLGDLRSGGGLQERTEDRLMGSLQWAINEQVHLSLGAILEWQSTETRTTEAVQFASRSAYWSTRGTWNSRYGQEEVKELDWTFSSKRTSFQIPLFVTIRASEVLEILLGLNRDMAQWKITDVTLARFSYRETSTNGTVERKENFGERYTMPTEQVTDVRTAFLAGLAVHVSNTFSVRALMVPNFVDTYEGTELQDLQWWLGLRLTP